jgi:hypothetical protein
MRKTVFTPFWFMYRPIACGVWSFCQDVEKKNGEQPSPASWCGPALALIRKVFESRAGFTEARSTLDQI